LGLRGATEAIAEWPLPDAGTALQIESTRHSPGELRAWIWPSAQGGYNTYILDGEFISPDGPQPGSGGSGVSNKKPWPKALIPKLMEMHGFVRAAITVQRVPYASPGVLDALAAELAQ
jgi:hypothetical protein